MYIIIKLLSYYYYFIIILFQHERTGLHNPILVLINSISSSSYELYISLLYNNIAYRYYINIKYEHINKLHNIHNISLHNIFSKPPLKLPLTP